ncbi:MAG: blaR1 2 [Planctomycetaceae bacterium]|nr:blaR1 2 [Planctomycetaceae bacterium]
MTDTLINVANFAGDRWAVGMISVVLDSAALLVLVGLVWLAIRKQVAPQVGYCLFLLVPLKLLVPLSVTVPTAIAQWTPSTMVSVWFDGVHKPEIIKTQPPIDGQIDSTRLDAAAPSESIFEELVTSQLAAAESVSTRESTAARPSLNIAPATNPVLDDPRQRQHLSMSAILALAWLFGVTLLLGRLVRSQLRFRAQLRRCKPLEESRLPVSLRELCQRAEITHKIRIVESDRVAAPAVWGIFRPTIILPYGIVASLSIPQLQWVLLHELAHIRRRDLLVLALQRFAAVLHFFNPAVWIANRMIHQLREYACDDLAVSWNTGSSIESGEAFLQILRHANRGSRGLEGALGIFGLDSRASCFQRVRRLLETDRPIRTRSGPWAVCSLILLAVIGLPHLRAGGDDPQTQAPAVTTAATPAQAPQKEKTLETLAKDTGEFALLVVGPDGKPVSEAQVELRVSPQPSAEQIRQGRFIKHNKYGADLLTDAQGRLTFKVTPPIGRFDLDITTPGFGPYWAAWSADSPANPIPANFTAELEAGWSVGGIIVDAAGNPIEGVKVHPSIKFKKRPGDEAVLGLGLSVKTDAAGNWHFDSVPASKSEVHVEINHPSYKAIRQPLARIEFGIALGQQPQHKISLNRGLNVTGKVTDVAGRPIAGVLVRTKFLNDIREAKTGDDGTYRLEGCEPRMANIVVSAKGRATDMQQVRVDPEMAPVNFQMQPGGKVRIHVLNNQGQPVPKARIFFQRWRKSYNIFEFDHVNQYANENGVWEWNEAPLDEFKADICPPNGMNLSLQPLLARDEPYVFRTPPALIVTGSVIDAETRQPIKKFQVVPGIRSSETHMNWVRGERHPGIDGTYNIRHSHDYFAHLIRIEAAGYQPSVSRDIKSNEGSITIDFALRKGSDVAATVLTPDGKPAAGALIALGVAGSQISIKNGELDKNSTYCAHQETDAAGEFRFPPQDGAYQLVILHSGGYAHIKSTSESLSPTIQLEAWAKAAGTFRIGKTPGSNVPITINTSRLHSYGEGQPSIFTHHDVRTGKEGQFRFERVVPGQARIGRRIMLTVNEGAEDVTSSSMLAADFISGETTELELGGTGRPIIGKLQPPKTFEGRVKWNFALIEASIYQAPLPRPADPPVPPDIAKDPLKNAEWMLKWQQTDAGQIWAAWKRAVEARQKLREVSPYFTATVDRNGNFRIDDVPEGTYMFIVRFDADAPGFLRDYRFTVPPQEPGTPDTPLDLGVLLLEKR